MAHVSSAAATFISRGGRRLVGRVLSGPLSRTAEGDHRPRRHFSRGHPARPRRCDGCASPRSIVQFRLLATASYALGPRPPRPLTPTPKEPSMPIASTPSLPAATPLPSNDQSGAFHLCGAGSFACQPHANGVYPDAATTHGRDRPPWTMRTRGQWGRKVSCAPVVDRRFGRVANSPQVTNLPHRPAAPRAVHLCSFVRESSTASSPWPDPETAPASAALLPPAPATTFPSLRPRTAPIPDSPRSPPAPAAPPPD